ncbi:hypothetical protein SK128_005202, partial [Halocaridina rubra]
LRTSLVEAGSPWNKGRDSDYYYEQLHPEDDLPVITTNNQEFAVNSGDPLILPCPIHNLGHFTLIWRRGGQILWVLQDRGNGPFVQSVSRDPRVSRNGTSLSIKGVLPDDENTYTCEISTRPPRSISHTLTVRVPPTIYPANNRSIMTIKMGDPAYLRCIVSGNPPPTVTWTKEIPGKPPLRMAEGVNYTITGSRPEDNGVYKCTADNGAVSAVHAFINLQVMYPPKVRVENEEVYGGVAYDAILACYVYAVPTPQVKWYRDNGAPVDPMRLSMAFDANKRYSLQFDKVQLEDFGYYTCNASNYMGNSSGLLRLTGRPKPVRYFSRSQGDKDTEYTLVWEAESYSPVLTYTIAYRNETDAAEQWVNFTVPGTTSSSFYHSKSHTFTDLKPGATYYVQISAKNEFGSSDVNETFAFTTYDPVSEAGGVTESQAPPLSEEDAVTVESPISNVEIDDTLLEVQEEEIFKSKETPSAAENSAISDGASETFGLTPQERRAQMVALVTAISLSSFFC